MSLACVLLLIGLTIYSVAQAQTLVTGPYVLTTYDIETLASRPGEILVGTRVQTHLEFDDPIEDATSARSDWFTIETRENRLSMRANQTSGRTDLMVVTGGRTVLLTVVIDDTLDAPQRYVIGRAKAPSPHVNSSSSSSVRQAQHLLDDVLGTGDTNWDKTFEEQGGATTALPVWLDFYAEATYAPNGALAIHYALSNQSSYPLAADVTRLRLDVDDPVAGPHKLPFTLSRVSAEGLTNRVAPGGVEFGTLLVKKAPGAPVILNWPLVHIGPGSSYTLRKTFYEGFVRELRP